MLATTGQGLSVRLGQKTHTRTQICQQHAIDGVRLAAAPLILRKSVLPQLCGGGSARGAFGGREVEKCRKSATEPAPTRAVNG